MRSLTRSFASALVERNIRVNAVAPGPIETPIFGRTGLSKEEMEGFASYVLNKVPMKRFGSLKKSPRLWPSWLPRTRLTSPA